MIVGLMLAKLHLKCVWLLLSVLLWKMPFSDSYLLFFCQRGVPARASVTMISSQDSLQSQALFNIKDSNKVGHHQFPSCNLQSCALDSYSYLYFILQEDRERRVLVRKFKFEEPRREQIDELKVCVAEIELICTYIYISVLVCGLML
jgi:hypothetical protein